MKRVRAEQSVGLEANSYHSSIPANPDHAEGVTAYDLSLGKPLPLPVKDMHDKDSGLFLDSYMEYLRAVADWRTDWNKMPTAMDNPASKKILECKAKEHTSGAVELMNANFIYYTTGVLPADIANEKGVVQLRSPPSIVSQTRAEREKRIPPRPQKISSSK